MGRPVDALGAAVLSVFGVLAGAVVYTILTRLMVTARANRLVPDHRRHRAGAAMVLSPLGIPGVPASQIVIMEIMHSVAGILAIHSLTRWKQ